MSFLTKVDKFGLADNVKLVIISTEDGDSYQETTALNAEGSVAASEVYGHTASPTCSYAIKSSLEDSPKDIVLGGVTTLSADDGTEEYYCLTEVNVQTTAGGAPTVSAKGERVPSGAPSCKYTIENGLAVSQKCHSQILLGAYSLQGDGCHVTDTSYTFNCNFNPTTKNGEYLAWDVSEGKIQAELNVVQTGDVKPVLSAGDGWIITSPLTQTNPDSDFATYTASLTKYLQKDAD